MKLFVALFAINVCVAIVLWLDLRQIRPIQAFEFEASAKEVHLLSPSARASERSCLLLGPFEQAEQGQSIFETLSEQGFKVDLIVQELEQAPGYWVYYGPLANYAEALVQLREFQSKKIDSFIITRDDLYGAISLGVFENIDSAQRMQSVMGKKGYPTSVRNIFKFKTVNWLQIEHPKNQEKYNKINGLMVASRDDLKMREIFCKTVASRKPFP